MPPVSSGTGSQTGSVSNPSAASSPLQPKPPHGDHKDIRSFISAKNPRSDVQLAATAAYYYQFEAPPSQKKVSIGKDDLQDACRKSGRARLRSPYKTLHNAHRLGLLDKADEAGKFSINAVGENLVAMTLPGDGDPKNKTPRKAKKVARKTGRAASRPNRTSKKA